MLLDGYYDTLRRKYDDKLRKESSSFKAEGEDNEEQVAVRGDVARLREEGAGYGHSCYS